MEISQDVLPKKLPSLVDIVLVVHNLLASAMAVCRSNISGGGQVVQGIHEKRGRVDGRNQEKE